MSTITNLSDGAASMKPASGEALTPASGELCLIFDAGVVAGPCGSLYSELWPEKRSFSTTPPLGEPKPGPNMRVGKD